MGTKQLEKWQEQAKVLQARIQREKAKQRAEDRKADTRRKILAGAVLLERAGRDPALKGELDAWLDDALKRPDDRALFDLEPLPGTAGAPDGAASEVGQRSAA